MQNSATHAVSDFSFLDQPGFQQKYLFGPDQNSINFYISGIRCSKCIRKLEELPLSVPGLQDLRIEMGKSLAYAKINPKVLSCSALAEAIMHAGFQPIPLANEADEARLQKIEARAELIRIGVAGACAGNIMTFSFATYFGDTESLYPIFSWLSFILYLPVVTYVAWPFYVGAWGSLKQRRISIDLPMAIASFSGFVFSTAALLKGKEDIYFDSLSGFLFLILVSRWGQQRLQKHFLRSNDFAETLRMERVRLLKGDQWSWVPLDSLKPGDHIRLFQHETLPAEAELATDKAYFGLAWLSGELKPKTFLKNSVVSAGSRLESAQADLMVKKLLNETNFGNILSEVQKFSLTKNKVVSVSDKWAQWLLGIVFTLALIFLLGYWQVSSEEAIRRSLALIILACPCAMAFGTPLALAAALRKAQRKGLLVRDANVFEKANNIDVIFFDKTGTLTETDLSLVQDNKEIDEYYKKVILSLENESLHPIAFAFRKAFEGFDAAFPVRNACEHTGVGVSGFINGKYYQIKKNPQTGTEIGCSLYEEGMLISNFTFTADLKSDALCVLENLRAQGYHTILLSGDKQGVVESLGEQLKFSKRNILYEVNPEQKAEVIKSAANSIMIGDGVNDSLALIKAKVSIASSGGVEAAFKSSDVYLTNPSVQGVLDLLQISREAMAAIHQNLLISVIYNSIGGTLALLGFINPFVAAVLMPISSGFILLSTWARSQR